MPRVPTAVPRARAALLLGAALGVSAPALLASFVAVPAHAFSQLVVSPLAVPPGGEVAVAGRCPKSAREPYVAATIGIEKLGQSTRVKVTDGAFTGTLELTPVGTVDPVPPGTEVAVQASCYTESEFVASAGTQKVEVVEKAALEPIGGVAVPTERGISRPAPAAPSASSASSAPSVPVAAAAAEERPSLAVPLGAFAIAVIGTIGAFVLSRRSKDRAEAMVGHPAQRGVGREPPRRDAK